MNTPLYKSIHVEVNFDQHARNLIVNGYGHIPFEELKPALELSLKYIEHLNINSIIVNETEVYSIDSEARNWLIYDFSVEFGRAIRTSSIELLHIPSNQHYMQSMSRIIGQNISKFFPTGLVMAQIASLASLSI